MRRLIPQGILLRLLTGGVESRLKRKPAVLVAAWADGQG